jgi:hypothetical protein
MAVRVIVIFAVLVLALLGLWYLFTENPDFFRGWQSNQSVNIRMPTPGVR